MTKVKNLAKQMTKDGEGRHQAPAKKIMKALESWGAEQLANGGHITKQEAFDFVTTLAADHNIEMS
jgi:hypothetical protein